MAWTYWKDSWRAFRSGWNCRRTGRGRRCRRMRRKRASVALPAERVAALKRLSHDSQATLYMTLLSAFAALL